MNKHFILVLYGKTSVTKGTQYIDLTKFAGGVEVEWAFIQDERQVCKINVVRPTVKLLYDGLQATGLYSEIKLYEHVEW